MHASAVPRVAAGWLPKPPARRALAFYAEHIVPHLIALAMRNRKLGCERRNSFGGN